MNEHEANVSIPEVTGAFEDAIMKHLEDPDIRRRAWFGFTDDTSLPEGTEDIARLAFDAGYLTAIGHVGQLLEALR